MKNPVVIAVLGLCLLLSVAAADNHRAKKPARVDAQTATAEAKRAPAINDLVRNVDAQNVGVCLRGKKARFIHKESEANNCDAVVWINARQWSAAQRHLIDNSASSTLAAGSGGKARCKTCKGTCQIVSWFSGGSKYEGVDVGGGQSPSQCIDAVKEACEAGASRFMASATCGN